MDVIYKDLGLCDYQKAWDFQEKLFNLIIDKKLAARKEGIENIPTENYLLICEHPPVFTLGKSGKEEHLLSTAHDLEMDQIGFYKINRGGDITYHGPGQLVVYPILNLDMFFTDIHLYLRYLEEAVIKTLEDLGINASRLEGKTGVWLDPEDPLKARKICAMGIKCSRWVTMHGIAFNVNNDLENFTKIIPCGIDDKGVTSVKKEYGADADLENVKASLIKHIAQLFGMNLVKGEEVHP